MKFAKRTLAIVLAMVLSLGLFALSTSADNDPPQPLPYTLGITVSPSIDPLTGLPRIDPVTGEVINVITSDSVNVLDYNIIYGNLHLSSVSITIFARALLGMICPQNPGSIILPEGGAAHIGGFTPSWRRIVVTPPIQFNVIWDVPGFSGFTLSSSDESVFRVEDGVIFTEQPGTAYFQLTLNEYPITFQKEVTVVPRTGDFEVPYGFLFDPHVVNMEAGETTTATLSLTQSFANFDGALPVAMPFPGDGDGPVHLMMSSNPDVAIAEMPTMPNDINEQLEYLNDQLFEQFEYYRDQYIEYLISLYEQGLISEAEGMQRLEQFEEELLQEMQGRMQEFMNELIQRYISSINIIGVSPGRAVITVIVAAIDMRGQIIEGLLPTVYYLEVFVAEPPPPPPPIPLPNPPVPGEVNVLFPEGTFPAGTKINVDPGHFSRIIDGYNVIADWEIWFEHNGMEVQPNGYVTVRLPIPYDYRDRANQLVVYHMCSTYFTLTRMETRIDGNYIVFEANSFSPFIIAEPIPVRTLTNAATRISIEFREDLLPEDVEWFVQVGGRGLNTLLFGTPGSFVNIAAWRIEPRVNGVAVQPDGYVTVRIPIPASFTGDPQDLRLELAGRRMNTRIEGNYIVFETNSF